MKKLTTCLLTIASINCTWQPSKNIFIRALSLSNTTLESGTRRFILDLKAKQIDQYSSTIRLLALWGKQQSEEAQHMARELHINLENDFSKYKQQSYRAIADEQDSLAKSTMKAVLNGTTARVDDYRKTLQGLINK